MKLSTWLMKSCGNLWTISARLTKMCELVEISDMLTKVRESIDES